jgi:hypothetical protein
VFRCHRRPIAIGVPFASVLRRSHDAPTTLPRRSLDATKLFFYTVYYRCFGPIGSGLPAWPPGCQVRRHRRAREPVRRATGPAWARPTGACSSRLPPALQAGHPRGRRGAAGPRPWRGPLECQGVRGDPGRTLPKGTLATRMLFCAIIAAEAPGQTARGRQGRGVGVRTVLLWSPRRLARPHERIRVGMPKGAGHVATRCRCEPRSDRTASFQEFTPRDPATEPHATPPSHPRRPPGALPGHPRRVSP